MGIVLCVSRQRLVAPQVKNTALARTQHRHNAPGADESRSNIALIGKWTAVFGLDDRRSLTSFWGPAVGSRARDG